jgi:hypothetical protein
MKLSLTEPELAAYVARQMEGLFPDGAGLGDAPRRHLAGTLSVGWVRRLETYPPSWLPSRLRERCDDMKDHKQEIASGKKMLT